MKHALAVAVTFVGPLLAQTTWIVNAGGGPGVHFTSLAAAVAAAADGDTILVQHPTQGLVLTGFTTDKALTIVGDHVGVPIGTVGAPIEILGLAAGKKFRMAGFQAIYDGELRIRVQNCAGEVHLENLVARSEGWFFPSTPAIDITNCASVTLRDVVDFGTPAVRIDSSLVVLNGCQLGITRINVGGGPCLWANNAVVDVVQPVFRTGGFLAQPGVGYACIVSTNSHLRLAGNGSALVSGGPPISATGGPAITANGGTVALDPAVVLTSGVGSPLFSGTATLVTAPVPASWTAMAIAAQSLSITTTAQAGSAVFQALGVPGPLTILVPLGLLGVDPGATWVFFAPLVVPASGQITNRVLVPGSMLPGSAFTTQAVVVFGASLQLGLPCTFVVH